ncbi:MAG: hypothetical protein MK066_08975 [Crocinitomicaceae bacterium]|nr:hypothetical protein [Crocinitomicaceae bacterium]
MKKQNKLETIGVIVLAIGGILFLINKLSKIVFLTPIMEFKEIILFSGLAIWALGSMQKENKKGKK